MVFLLWPHSDSPILDRALRIFPFTALLIMQVIFFGKHWHEWIGWLSAFAVLLMLFFISPLVGRTRGLSYAEKLLEFDTRQSTWTVTVVFHLMGSTLGRRLGTIWLWAWFSLVACGNAGRFSAMWKQEFLIPSSCLNCVVLSSFGENLIVAPFDRKTKLVERSFSIIKKGEDPKLVLSWEVVGPLQLKTPPTDVPQLNPKSASPSSPSVK